jgi:hypothetical protein
MQELNLRGALGLILTALSLWSGVAVPLLDRDAWSFHAAMESQHDPATCAPAHDHRICTQVGAKHSLTNATQSRHRALGRRAQHGRPVPGPAPALPSASAGLTI